jgi:hypothetical protein
MMVSDLVKSLVVSLAFTLAAELLFALLLGKRGKDLALVSLVNILTNPPVVLLYFLASAYTALSPALLKASLEIAAVLVEAFCYRKYGGNFRRPLLFSLGANAFSFGLGELIVLIGG